MKDTFAKTEKWQINFGVNEKYGLEVRRSVFEDAVFLRDNASEDAETVKIMPADLNRLIDVLKQAQEILINSRKALD